MRHCKHLSKMLLPTLGRGCMCGCVFACFLSFYFFEIIPLSCAIHRCFPRPSHIPVGRGGDGGGGGRRSSFMGERVR